MMNPNLPILITAYNRPKHLAKTLECLSACINAHEHDLHVFIDKADDPDVYQQVIEVATSASGFKNVFVQAKNHRIGLANNVIQSVNEVMNEYPGLIALEDDMLVNRHFLSFMNESFYHYQDNPNIGCITGYTPPLKNISTIIQDDLFASSRSSTWGWSMKKEDWQSINWQKSYFAGLLDDPTFLIKFSAAGNDRVRILRGYIEGRLNIWGIRRGAWQVENQKLTLYPTNTLLANIGLDGSGQNCGISDEHSFQGMTESDFLPNKFPVITSYQVDAQCEEMIRQFYSI